MMSDVVEYRCSKCGQIGGHTDDDGTMVYDGCPKGGKHDINGGTV